MKLRMTMATAVLGIAMATLGACGSDTGSDGSSPSTSGATSESPSADSPDPATALQGDWQIPAENYVLHLKSDGTFTEDFQGVVDFRTGTYSVDGETLSLEGGDGNTDDAMITGDTLVFTLGTATRLE